MRDSFTSTSLRFIRVKVLELKERDGNNKGFIELNVCICEGVKVSKELILMEMTLNASIHSHPSV